MKALRTHPCLLALALILAVPYGAEAAEPSALNMPGQDGDGTKTHQRLAAAHLQAGIDLEAREKFAPAAEEFVKALALDPQSAEAHYHLGLVRLHWSDLGAAIKSFRTVLELDPHHATAQLRLANALTQLARDDERFVGEAIAAYQQALTMDPRQPEAHFNLGFLAMRRLNYRNATEEYEKARSLDPHYPGVNLALCISVYKLGEFEHADALCRDTVIHEPGSAPAHHYLGLVMSKRERWEPAVQELRAAIHLDPSDYQMHYALAQALRKTGHTDEAAAESEIVRKMQTGSTSNLEEGYLENQTKKMLDAGDVDGAIENDRQAFKLKKDARSATNLASALLWKGSVEEAIDVLHQALHIDPNYAWAHYYLGVALARKREFEKAVEPLDQALKLQPNFPEAEFYLGLCYAGRGSLQDAETHLRAAIAMRPDVAPAHQYLGMVLEQLGKHDESRTELQAARLLDSNSEPEGAAQPPDAYEVKESK